MPCFRLTRRDGRSITISCDSQFAVVSDFVRTDLTIEEGEEELHGTPDGGMECRFGVVKYLLPHPVGYPPSTSGSGVVPLTGTVREAIDRQDHLVAKVLVGEIERG